jgi:hypothetical protein
MTEKDGTRISILTQRHHLTGVGKWICVFFLAFALSLMEGEGKGRCTVCSFQMMILWLAGHDLDEGETGEPGNVCSNTESV